MRAVLAVVLAIAALGGWLLIGISQPVEQAPVSSLPLNQGYPGPTDTATPLPTATPSPDVQGYFPAPTTLQVISTTLTTSPHSAFLSTLQTELDNQDSAAISSRNRGYNRAIPMEWMEGGVSVTTTQLATLLTGQFTQGSTPKIQGYFEKLRLDNDYCLYVLAAEWEGVVALPTPSSPRGESPANMAGNTAALEFCFTRGGTLGPDFWQWKIWRFGDDYYGAIDWLAEYIIDEPYYVVRP